MPTWNVVDLTDEAATLRALGHAHRLGLVARLAELEARGGGGARPSGPSRTAGQLARDLRISGPTLSHHLSALRAAGLVRSTRRGQEVQCRLDPARLTDVVRLLTALAAGRVGRAPPRALFRESSQSRG